MTLNVKNGNLFMIQNLVQDLLLYPYIDGYITHICNKRILESDYTHFVPVDFTIYVKDKQFDIIKDDKPHITYGIPRSESMLTVDEVIKQIKELTTKNERDLSNDKVLFDCDMKTYSISIHIA